MSHWTKIIFSSMKFYLLFCIMDTNNDTFTTKLIKNNYQGFVINVIYLQKAWILTIVLLVRLPNFNPSTAPGRLYICEEISICLIYHPEISNNCEGFTQCFIFLCEVPADVFIATISTIRSSIAEFPNVDALPAWTVELRFFTRSLLNIPTKHLRS